MKTWQVDDIRDGEVQDWLCKECKKRIFLEIRFSW